MKENNLSINEIIEDQDFTSCCSNFYESEIVKFFLGPSFHPGGTELTIELGSMLGIDSGSTVLDVACGNGTSAIALNKEFDCKVVGIDQSEKNIQMAKDKASKLQLKDKLKFKISKVEELPFPSNNFDYVITECSFCIFQSKPKIAQELFDVLKPGGKLGLSDVSIEKDLPYEMQEMVYRVACISAALSASSYRSTFEDAGFREIELYDRKETILDLHRKMKKKLVGLKLAKKFKPNFNGINLRELDLHWVKSALKQMKTFVDDNFGSYILLTAKKL